MRDAVRALEQYAQELELTWDAQMEERFLLFGETLLEWNQKMNLTAITQPEEIAIKHFYDSLALLRYLRPALGAKLIDVGTGAGFPAIPLLIARPDLQVTLLDSTKKRLVFLEEVLRRTGLNANPLHARGEEAGQRREYREQYDIATARAVAVLPVLAEYCLPFVKKGGVFAAMKGPEMTEECRMAERAFKELGGAEEHLHTFCLPDGSRRTVVLIRKMSQTSPKYPRVSAKIAKKPL